MASDFRNPSSNAPGNLPNGALLTADDPPPVRIVNPAGLSSFLLIGDHAGNLIPRGLDLGVAAADLTRHIAWDIGVDRLGAMLSRRLDAVFVAQTYSRLVIDCNRREDAEDAIPATSDGTVIPANAALTDAGRLARLDHIHRPYHAAIAREVSRRDAAGVTTTLVALHSFTPRMTSGEPRPWQIGILHDGGEPGFARACLATLRADPTLSVGDNEPYRMDQIDYTIPHHAYPADRPYVEIEIRQDLLCDDAAVSNWCERVAVMLIEAASTWIASAGGSTS